MITSAALRRWGSKSGQGVGAGVGLGLGVGEGVGGAIVADTAG